MAKGRAYDNLYARLETKEGEKELYRLARQRDRAGKNVQHVGVIKDENGNVMVNLEAVLKRWKEYFEKLMNEENNRDPRTEEAEVVNPLMTTTRNCHNIFVIFLCSCTFSLIKTKMKKYLKIYFRFSSYGMFPYGNNGHKQYRNYKIKQQFACFVSRIFLRLNSQEAAAVTQGLIYLLLFRFIF